MSCGSIQRCGLFARGRAPPTVARFRAGFFRRRINSDSAMAKFRIMASACRGTAPLGSLASPLFAPRIRLRQYVTATLVTHPRLHKMKVQDLDIPFSPHTRCMNCRASIIPVYGFSSTTPSHRSSWQARQPHADVMWLGLGESAVTVRHSWRRVLVIFR